MIERLVVIILFHLTGDYALQSDFIAKTKGQNWYHLFVHCALYIIPFYISFGFDWRLACLFIPHLIIDSLKARYNIIPDRLEQIAHYVIGIGFYI